MINSITIGCSFRPDGQGEAQEVAEKQCLKLLTQLRGIDAVKIVILPRGAHGSQTPERILHKTDLAGIDAIFIPGGRVSNSTQVKAARAQQDDLSGDFRKPLFCNSFPREQREALTKEAQSRERYERDLVRLAREHGIPMLGVCAGLWRVVEAFGGQVELLPKNERSIHEVGHWNNYHGLQIKPGTHLSSLSTHLERTQPNFSLDRLAVNSSHWAAPEQDARHKLVQKSPSGENPNNTLEISAVTAESGVYASVEAVENRSGAPVWGTQFHPETVMFMLGGITKESAHPLIKNLVEAMTQAGPAFIAFSIELMTAFTQAALTKARHRAVIDTLKAQG